MQRISSDMTFYYKRVCPVVLLAFLGVIVIVALSHGPASNQMPFLITAIFVPIALYAIMKVTGIFDLVDEVFDAGDALIIKKDGREERVLLADIIAVDYELHPGPPRVTVETRGLPPRVTLLLRTPSQFGDRLSFLTPMTYWGPSPIIEELMRRIWLAQPGGPASKPTPPASPVQPTITLWNVIKCFFPIILFVVVITVLGQAFYTWLFVVAFVGMFFFVLGRDFWRSRHPEE